jgi:Ankyrin repeats (3 copies)
MGKVRKFFAILRRAFNEAKKRGRNSIFATDDKPVTDLTSATKIEKVTLTDDNSKNATQKLSKKNKPPVATGHSANKSNSAENRSIMQFLKGKGIDARVPGFDVTAGFVPAIKHDREDVIRWLIDRGIGAPLNVALNIALHEAARYGRVHIAQLLLNNGADVHAIDADNGEIALHLAARVGNASMVELLLKAGANGRLRNNSGKIPYQLAGDNGRETAFMIFHRWLEPGKPVRVEWHDKGFPIERSDDSARMEQPNEPAPTEQPNEPVPIEQPDEPAPTERPGK